MVTKIGINGFGRVGRVVFRTCLEHPDVEVSAINDPAIEVDYICYLIKYDSTHGTLKNNVTHTEDEVKVDELCVKVFQQKLPTNIPWHTAGVQYVVEASGMFTSFDKASGHLECDGIKRIIVTAPSVDVPMIILGVNESKMKPEHKVISCGSSTLYCLAPIVKILEDNYGLEEGFITSIHAMTPSLKPLDGLCLRGKHWRDHRSITQNIIPAVTGACRALGRVLPAVRDKVCGLAFRVPIANVSVLDLTIRLKKFTSIENIVEQVEKFSKSSKQTIIKTSCEESVSSDFVGDRHSCILDVGSSLQLKPNAFKLICWYENEYSYACRVVDLILFSEAQFNQLMTNKNKTTYVRPKTFKNQDVNQLTECITQDGIRKNIVDNKKYKISAIKLPALCAKPKPRQMLLKRPIVIQSQTPTTEDRERNRQIELFKVWNDGNDAKKDNTIPQPMRLSPLQICNKFTKQNNTAVDCFKAQERLEKVKQEFTKMVNITEDLLRKSNTSSIQLTSKEELVNVSLSDVKSSESKHVVFKNVETTLIKKANPVMFDVSGDRASGSTINSKNMFLYSSKEDVDSALYEKDQSNYSMLMSGHKSTVSSSVTSESLKEMSELKESINVALDSMNKYQERSSNASSSNRNFMAKTFANIFDGFSKNFSFTNKTVFAVREPTTSKENINESFEKHDEEAQDDIKMKNAQLLKPEEDNLIDDKTSTAKVLKAENINLINSPTTITSEEKVESILTVESFCDNETNKIVNDDTGHREDEYKQRNEPMVDEHSENTHITDKYCDDNDNIISDNGSNAAVLQKRECSYTSMPESFAAGADESGCASPDYRSKQDIYDKLDSTSDSDNSFEIDGKKSQVIKISDLTNSLEDLDRLDKICRIMEISDELSNELFSTLDDSLDNTSAAKKKWSFKDLCEKINLDEFCNKVFGK